MSSTTGTSTPSELQSRSSVFDAHESLLICIVCKVSIFHNLHKRFDADLHATNQHQSLQEGEDGEKELNESQVTKEQNAIKELAERTKTHAFEWLNKICFQFGVEPDNLPDEPFDHLQEFNESIPEEKKDDLVFELVLTSIGLGKFDKQQLKEQVVTTNSVKNWLPGGKKSDQELKPKEPTLNYSSLSRALVANSALLLGIHQDSLAENEKLISQALFFELQKEQQEQRESGKEGASNEWDQATKNYKNEQKGKSNVLKWSATAAGFVAGGAIIGLTGGLAAPAIAPLLVGTLGMGIFAGSGGIILIGTLLGLGGGGLAGYRTHRRMEGLKDISFTPLTDPDLPTIPSLTATIVVSGFLLDLSDSINPWLPTFQASKTDTFALKVDPEAFLQAGKAYGSWVRDKLVSMGGIEVIKHTALSALYAGVALPLSIYNGATMVLDSDFTRCREKAKKAGILLAEILEKQVQGNRPVRLMGYGVGGSVIFSCLMKMYEKKLEGLVYDVVLIGLPESPEKVSWSQARSIVANDFVNCYSNKDWTLALHTRLYTLSNRVGGLTKIDVVGVRNVDVSDIVTGHLEIRDKVTEVLTRVREGGGPVPTPEKDEG